MTRVLVTGSRTWRTTETIETALAQVEAAYRPPYLLVHGNAPGADQLAEYIAVERGWNIESHPAHWEEYGRKAGFVRNREMVELGADICLAFIRDESKGATMTADMARREGITTLTYREQGEKS